MQTSQINEYQQVAEPVQAATLSRLFSPIDQESRSHVETACAAFHLMRKPQTLRAWACHENGPLRPVRIMGRLAWKVDDIKRLVAEGSAA